MVNNISILKNVTILYAEDEKDLREVTHQILKGFTKKQYDCQPKNVLSFRTQISYFGQASYTGM